jgi:hypothetical protein
MQSSIDQIILIITVVSNGMFILVGGEVNARRRLQYQVLEGLVHIVEVCESVLLSSFRLLF